MTFRALRVLAKALLVLALLGAIVVTPACAQTPTASYGAWKTAPIGGGGYLQQVFFAPSDARRMYMTSDVGGLFRSDNGGQNWRMLHGALPADAGSYSPRGFLVHPRDAGRILAATGSVWGGVNGVFLSKDGGASWTQTLKARFDANTWDRSAGNVMAMSPRDPNLILAGQLGGGIARSTDGGQNWTMSGPDDLHTTAILFDRSNPNRVWLCARPYGEIKQKRADGSEVELRGGFFRSDDGGRNWTQIAQPLMPTEVIQDPNDAGILFALMGEQQVMRSTDGGQSWKSFSDGLAPRIKGDARSDGAYEAIAAGPNFLLLGGQGGNFYRLDKGQSRWRKIELQSIDEGNWWGRITPGAYRHFGSALGFVGIDPRDPNHWVFTDWYALYQTRDAGKTWKLTIDGVEMTVINTVAQAPENANAFHAGMADVGYFRSTDGGASMQQVTSEISSNVKTIAAAPSQAGRVYATGTGDWEWKANALFISDDAGVSWRRSAMRGLPDMKERRSETVAPHPTKRDEVWLTVSGDVKPNEGGPWRSTDGGASWTWAGEGLPQTGGYFRSGYWVSGPELTISPDGSMIATSDDRRLLARRGPNDSTWTMVDVPDGTPNCVAADALHPGRFYLACNEGGLWQSSDGGASWKNIVDRDVHWVASDMKREGRVAAVTSSGVLVSADAGATWREMSRALPYRHPRNVVCFAGEKVVVGTGGNGVFYAPLSSLQGAASTRARVASLNAAPQNVAALSNPDEVVPLPLKIAASDSRLHYQGRFDWSDKVAPRSAWPASTLALRFRGTALNVRLQGAQNVHWQIEVDGVPTTKLRLNDAEKLYRVASGLAPGEHTVRLVQATEALFGTTRVLGLELNRGAQLLSLPVPKRRIEIIGDSISAGFGNEAGSKDEHFSPETENAYFSYGALAAKELGADFTCLAWSGKKMWPDNTLPELYDRTIPTEENSRWDFKTPAPDVVLINLATNDFYGKTPDEAGWTGAYKTFLARVRKNYPNAQIYCATGSMMDGDSLAALRNYLTKIIAERKAEGDDKVRLIEFPTQDAANGFGADWHPSLKTHRLMAAQLAQTLRRDLKW